MSPTRGDRAWLLNAQQGALRAAAKIDGVFALWPPRLTDFPPRRQGIASGDLRELFASGLRAGKVHFGCVLQLTTISQCSLCGNSVVVVAEDLEGVALRLVIHYFTSARTLDGIDKEMPQGTRVCVKEPHFEDFPKGGPAVCCAQTANLVIQRANQRPQSPLAGVAQHSAGVDERMEDAAGQCLSTQRAEMNACERERGEYDFLALHRADSIAPTRSPCAAYLSPCVTIEDLGERGRGVIARAALSAGDLIMGSKAEHIVFNRELSARGLWRAPGWDEDGLDCAADTILMQCIAQDVLTSAERRTALLGLSQGSGRPLPDDTALEQLLHVVKTNRFTASHPWDGSTAGTGLWMQQSRLNHACDANSAWSTVGDMLFIRCQKDVAAGEELTIPYCNPTDAVEERRKFLLDRHGFVCHCSLCELESAGGVGAAEYNKHVEEAELCEGLSVPDWKGSLRHRTAAFKFLSSPEYCSQRQAQTEHAIAANAACHRLHLPKVANFWLQESRKSFAMQWGNDVNVFNFYASRCGVVGADFS